MKILPTLNIENGAVVSVAGFDRATGEPKALLAFLLEQGCHRLALVDVDAARGQGNNRELIARLMKQFHAGRAKACIQVGGGIRSSDQAQFFMDNGATWLTVGTILQKSPLMVEQLLARFREHLTAVVYARGGQVQASGWGGPSDQKAETSGARIAEFGFKRLLFVDMPLDPEASPDFATARTLSQCARIPLYMGGSVRTLEHMAKARETQGVQGISLDGLLLSRDPSLAAALNLPSC